MALARHYRITVLRGRVDALGLALHRHGTDGKHRTGALGELSGSFADAIPHGAVAACAQRR
jgi:hypothetical protein